MEGGKGKRARGHPESRRTKGGRCRRHRPGSVRLRWARSCRPFVRRGSEGRSAPAPPPPPPPPAPAPQRQRRQQRQPHRPPALPPGRCRYLCPLAAVPARRCAPAAVRRVRRSGAARLAAPSRRKRVPSSQKKHPTALSPRLPVPAPGPWLCSSAPAFLPGPTGDWSLEPVPLYQPGFGDRFVPGAVCCWRRQHGSAVWQVPGRLGHLCSALPPPKRAVPDTGKSRSQRENKEKPCFHCLAARGNMMFHGLRTKMGHGQRGDFAGIGKILQV
ncbi:formin-like protein 3 isoform X2 [Pyrgilauda ruficollis]|uniref:formin-like protein 3 isoform X2 n=1 Tax=Pyrgilauda ruficollis TaxID=221976 RepID=UPI001B872BAD|nr:formin-like protein 3 isoform X2 [Pyrgilauda ruficollis]